MIGNDPYFLHTRQKGALHAERLFYIWRLHAPPLYKPIPQPHINKQTKRRKGSEDLFPHPDRFHSGAGVPEHGNQSHRGEESHDKRNSEPESRHLCRRMLLVHGIGFREGARHPEGRLGIHGRQKGKPDLRGGLIGPHGPPGGRPGLLRPGKGYLRAAPGGLLAAHRPHRRGRSVRRPGLPVPQRRFLP